MEEVSRSHSPYDWATEIMDRRIARIKAAIRKHKPVTERPVMDLYEPDVYSILCFDERYFE